MSLHDLTAKIAYRLYQHRDYAHGQHRADWFAAEDIISAMGPQIRAHTSGPPEAGPAADVETEDRAMTTLREASEVYGRAGVSAALGYRSTSMVAATLRGDRMVSSTLADRILGTFKEQAPPAPLKVIKGDAQRRKAA